MRGKERKRIKLKIRRRSREGKGNLRKEMETKVGDVNESRK